MRLIKFNTLSKIFLFSAMLLVSQNAFAGDSITYNIAARMINTVEGISLSLFDSLAEAYKPLYVNIAAIGLMVILIKYLFTRVLPLLDLLNFTISLTIISAIAFNSSIFKSVVYDTFFDTLYNINQYIVQVSAKHIPNAPSLSFGSISNMFHVIDQSIMEIANFSYSLIDNKNGIFSNLWIGIQSFLIFLLYLFVSLYFLVVFSVAILGAHMMIIFMPITLSLYPFKRLRHYFSNSINGILHYGLTAIFASIAICISLSLVSDLAVEARRLKDENINEIPADFLVGAIMIGFLSIFVIKMSSEFAGRIINASTSQLGGAFPMIVAGATTAAKAATTIPFFGGSNKNSLSAVNNSASSINNTNQSQSSSSTGSSSSQSSTSTKSWNRARPMFNSSSTTNKKK